MAKVAKVKTRIVITIFEPVKEDPKTHKPKIEFSGELISNGLWEKLSFMVRKERRRWQVEVGNQIKQEAEERDKELRKESEDAGTTGSAESESGSGPTGPVTESGTRIF